MSDTTTNWTPQKSLKLDRLWLRGTAACHRCTIKTQPTYLSVGLWCPDNGKGDYTNIRPRHKTQSCVTLRGWSSTPPPQNVSNYCRRPTRTSLTLTVVERREFQTDIREWWTRDVFQLKLTGLKCTCVLCVFNYIHVNTCTVLFNRL